MDQNTAIEAVTNYVQSELRHREDIAELAMTVEHSSNWNMQGGTATRVLTLGDISVTATIRVERNEEAPFMLEVHNAGVSLRFAQADQATGFVNLINRRLQGWR